MAGEYAGIDEWLDVYGRIESDFVQGLRDSGLAVGECDATCPRRDELLVRLAAKGAIIRNAGASVVSGAVSAACVACTGCAGSETFFISLKCGRDCFYCFNPNQQHYEYFLEHDRDWRGEFGAICREGRSLSHVALTGGEPLLHFEKTRDFFETARRLWPDAHLRLYTSGMGMTRERLAALMGAGLSEVRISVKMEDGAGEVKRALACVALAREFAGLDVMVEMPVIPGSLEAMKDLLVRLDELGAFGINLLEFCYPMHNWDAFARLDLKVKNPPFDVLYDYGYAGSLPIEGSELEALELVEFALDRGLGLGVHYCSLDNKHRDQVLTQNSAAQLDNPCYVLDRGDFFYKTHKAFGEDAAAAVRALECAGAGAWEQDSQDGSVSFHPSLEAVVAASGARIAESFNVLENRSGDIVLRELALREI